MRASDKHLGGACHELTKQVGAANDRNVMFPRRHQLGVVLRDRRKRSNHHRRQLPAQGQVFGLMPHRHVRPHGLQSQHGAGFFHVGARHHLSTGEEDTGHTGHAGPANANEVDSGQINIRHGSHFTFRISFRIPLGVREIRAVGRRKA